MKNNSPATSTKALPPISTLLSDSFKLLKIVIVPFIIFNVLAIAISITAVILMLLGFLLLGIGAGLGGLFTDNPLALGGGAIVEFLIFFIVMLVISSIAQIGSIIILYDANPKINVFSVIKRGTRLIIPLILVGILVTFFVLGGSFLFIIPGIIFAVALVFSYLLVITENKSPLSAVKRSIFLVKSNLSAFILRILALYAILIVALVTISIVTGILTVSINIPEVTSAVLIINFIVQVLVSWYAVAYTVTLFKQLQKNTASGESSLKLFTVLAVIGWILGIILGYFIFITVGNLISQFKSGDLRQELTPGEKEEFENLLEDFENEFKIEDIDRYLDEGTNSSEIETSTPPAETI